MKRTLLSRRAPLKRGLPLARHTRIRRVNHHRIRARRAACFGAQADLCRTMPCLACWAPGCEPHHEPPRSCGGRDSACVPLCPDHHRQRHAIGRAAFEAHYKIDLRAEAARLARIVAGNVSLPLPEQQDVPEQG